VAEGRGYFGEKVMSGSVTIAVVPRDRFSKTAVVIRSILTHTPPPFRLVIVATGMPPRYLDEIEREAKGHADTRILKSDEQLNSNAAKNWVIREVTDSEYLALVENDVEVEVGWLEKLIVACEREGADVARPLIMERKIFGTHPHFDQRLGRIQKIENADGTPTFRFFRRSKPLSSDLEMKRQLTTVLETHCLLFKRSVFDRVAEFDERLTVRQEVDLALELLNADIPIVFEPDVAITYHRPPPVNRDERGYFKTRWDFVQGIRSHQIIEDRWNMIDFPDSIAFAQHRHKLATYHSFATYYFRHEFVSYLRWELWPKFKYRIYRLASHFPAPLREPVQRALYR
jgi:GT2 family glycosyltransferase